jgi:hypothetical protein
MKRHKNPHAVALGRLGGKTKTEARTIASKANGRFGGRPKMPIPKSIICEDGNRRWIKIPLSTGEFALIDEEDKSQASYRWHCHRSRRHLKYAIRKETVNGRRVNIFLHNAILTPPFGSKIDHVSGNGLDNRRQNLRFATRTQNGWNRRKWVGKSRFKGVSKYYNKYQAKIKANGALSHLGTFESEVEAARAYDCAALKHFGEFACINFPGDVKE